MNPEQQEWRRAKKPMMFALQLIDCDSIFSDNHALKYILGTGDLRGPIGVVTKKEVALPGDHKEWERRYAGRLWNNNRLLGFYSTLRNAQNVLVPSKAEWVRVDNENFLCITVPEFRTKNEIEQYYKNPNDGVVAEVLIKEEFDKVITKLLHRDTVRWILNDAVKEYREKSSNCDTSLCNVSCLPLCFLRCFAERKPTLCEHATPQEKIAHEGINDYLEGECCYCYSGEDTAVRCIDKTTGNGPCFLTCCPKYYNVSTKDAQRIAAKFPPTALEMKRN